MRPVGFRKDGKIARQGSSREVASQDSRSRRAVEYVSGTLLAEKRVGISTPGSFGDEGIQLGNVIDRLDPVTMSPSDVAETRGQNRESRRASRLQTALLATLFADLLAKVFCQHLDGAVLSHRLNR